MTTKFAILNPNTGVYTKVETEQEREKLLRETAMEFYLLHTHGVPYSVVTSNDDGSENWSVPNDEHL